MTRIVYLSVIAAVAVVSISKVQGQYCDGTQTFSDIVIGGGNVITWQVDNDCAKAVYELKEFRWNKWVALGSVKSKGVASNSYQYTVDSTCDLHNVRISLKGNRRCRSAKVDNPNAPVISQQGTSNTDVVFSGTTRYEIYSVEGKRVRTGCSDKVNISDLPSGVYALNFGTTMTKLNKR